MGLDEGAPFDVQEFLVAFAEGDLTKLRDMILTYCEEIAEHWLEDTPTDRMARSVLQANRINLEILAASKNDDEPPMQGMHQLWSPWMMETTKALAALAQLTRLKIEFEKRQKG